MAVTVKDLRIEFPDKLVFEDVNLSLDDNEIVAIRTRVLDGGTSLLKGIAGFMNNVAGEVEYLGVNLLRNPPAHVLFKVGFVYENHGLISLYNVFQNIGLPLQFHTNFSIEEINERVDGVCRFLGIDEALYFLRPHRLNDVQTRMVNLARALVVEPGLLLIDELEGGMSDEMIRDTMNRLRERQQESPMAIVITTSNPIVMSTADRVFAIEDRKLVQRTDL
ncbi:MAG: ATP-binding cassette domain-containing protein [Pseudomonadales bacterium]|nr:ATP-binding cassette domain-containing protein [Pseudomonadales bacterium]